MSKKPSVLLTRKYPIAVEERLRRDYDCHFNDDDRLYSSDELIKLAEGMDAIMPCHSEKFTPEVVAKLPDSVKIVANFSVGVDHCDLEALSKRGIVVTNTPDVLSDATAEIAILLMLGAARRASEGEALMRQGTWNTWSPAFMVGSAVSGKSIGIVGMGRVGQVIAKRARGFDMTVHYHNRNRIAPDLEAGAVYHKNLDGLLGECDFISLSCPVTEDTKGLLSKERISKMRDGVILINTARGALIDEDALVEALKSGKIRAAGLDVYDTEPGGNPEITKLPNTFLLPHIGSANEETRDAMGFRALDNLDTFFGGSEPKDRVA